MMSVRLTNPKAATVARRAVILSKVGSIFYPFGMKALAWGEDVRIKAPNFHALKTAFASEGLDLVRV